MTSVILSIGTAILFVYGIAVTYFLYNLLKQNEKYEQWYVNISEDIVSTYERMKEIDDKQMFESDDEVGIIFDEMKQLIYSLENNKDIIYAEEEDEET